jgi:hypothetical protein
MPELKPLTLFVAELIGALALAAGAWWVVSAIAAGSGQSWIR